MSRLPAGLSGPATNGRSPAAQARRRDAMRDGLKWAVLLAVISALLVARLSPALSIPEFAALGQWMSLRPTRQIDPHIVLVGISKEDADAYEKERPAECACAIVKRSAIGETIRRIKQAGSRVIVLDLMLGQACPIPGHDQALVEALDPQKVPGEAILTLKANPAPDRVYFSKPPSIFMGPGEPRLVGSPVMYNPLGEIRGVRLIQVGVPTVQDQRSASGLDLVGETQPPLCLAAYTAYRGDPCEVPVAPLEKLVQCCDTDIPVWPDGRIYLMEPFMPSAAPSMHIMLINWAGPAGAAPMLDLAAVNRATTEQLQAWFMGRIVFIGSSVERQNTPMPGATRAAQPPYLNQAGQASMSGMEVHAQALDTIMQRRFLRPLPVLSVWVLLLACTLLTSLLVMRASLLSAVVGTTLEVGALVVAAMLLVRQDIWLYSVIPSSGIVLSAVATGLWGYARSRHAAATLAEEVEVRETTTAALAHDLKQPLAAISGLAAAIRATQQSEHADMTSPELVQRIQRQVERALADIDDLLMTAAEKELAICPQRFDLAALARDLAVAQSLKSPVHQVEVRSSAAQLWLVADARYIGRALNNLVDNAIKYWPEGGTVYVDLREGAGGGGGARD